MESNAAVVRKEEWARLECACFRRLWLRAINRENRTHAYEEADFLNTATSNLLRSARDCVLLLASDLIFGFSPGAAAQIKDCILKFEWCGTLARCLRD